MYQGLGQIETALDLAGTIAGKAWDMLDAFAGLFGVGEGRREADVIVPVQNDIAARLDAITGGSSLVNLDRAATSTLQSYFSEVDQLKRFFLEFIHDPRFEDGRASAQAEADMLPIFDGILAAIRQRLQARGATVPALQPSQSYGVPRLSYPTASSPYLPESGYIPPTSPIREVYDRPTSRIVTADSGSGLLLPVAIGGALLLLLRR